MTRRHAESHDSSCRVGAHQVSCILPPRRSAAEGSGFVFADESHFAIITWHAAGCLPQPVARPWLWQPGSAPPDWSGERRRSGAGCWNPRRCSRAPLPSEFPRNPDGARAAPEWGGGVICVDIGWCRGGTGIAEKAISNRRTTCVPTQPLVCRNDQKELIRPTSSRRGLLSGSCNSSKGGTSKKNRWSCKIITWTNVEIK